MATVNVHPATAQGAPGKVREEPIGDSSWLAKIKYDPQSLQLTVTTKRGDEYVHFYVFPATVDQLMQAPSKGRFYAQQIKGRGFSTRVISKTTGEPYRNPGKPVEPGRRTHGR